jgi:hypothetical protein
MAGDVNLGDFVPHAMMKGLTKLGRLASSASVRGRDPVWWVKGDSPHTGTRLSLAHAFEALELLERPLGRLAQVIVLALTLLDEIGQLIGQELRRHPVVGELGVCVACELGVHVVCFLSLCLLRSLMLSQVCGGVMTVPTLERSQFLRVGMRTQDVVSEMEMMARVSICIGA